MRCLALPLPKSPALLQELTETAPPPSHGCGLCRRHPRPPEVRPGTPRSRPWLSARTEAPFEDFYFKIHTGLL